MKYPFLLICLLFLLTNCKTLPDPIVFQKNVKFEETAEEDYISPSFQRNLDSNYSMCLIIRTEFEPMSEIVSENLNESNKPVLELENSLVKNYFRVYDRAIYLDKEADTKNPKYPFDFIVEIVKIEDTKHYTGIILHRDFHHFLEGKILTLRIINPNTGEIVAVINSEYVPCQNGCKIKYDKYFTLEITDFQNNEKLHGLKSQEEISDYILSKLCNDISEYIRLEMNKT